MKKQRTIIFTLLVLLLVLSIMLVTACSDPQATADDPDSTQTQDGTAEVNDADNIVTNGTFYSAYNSSGSNYVKKDTIKGWSAKTGSAIYTSEDDKNTANTTFNLVQGVVDLSTWAEDGGINKTLFGSDTAPSNKVDFSKIEVDTNPNKPYDDKNALMIASDMSGDEIFNSSSYYYTSTTFTAAAGKSYELSIDVLTLLLNGNALDKETGDYWNSEDYGKGAYVVVTDSNNSYVLQKVEAINTYGEWQTIKIMIDANGESDVKIGLQLWMGHGTAYVQGGTVNDRLTKGVCLFDNVIMKESTDAAYTEAKEKVEAKVKSGNTDANSVYQKDGSKYVLNLKDWGTIEKYALYSYASKSSTSTSYDYYYTARVGNPSAYTVMKGVSNYSDYSSDELPYYSSSSYLPYGIFDYSMVYSDNRPYVKDFTEYNKTDWASFPKADFFTNGDFDNNAFYAEFGEDTPLTDTKGLLIYNYVPSGVGYKANDLITIEQGKYYNVTIYAYLYQALRLDASKNSDLTEDEANANLTRIKTFNSAVNVGIKATAKMTDVTFDGQNKSEEYLLTGYATYAETYRQSIISDTSIKKSVRDKWEALAPDSTISSLPVELEYYYEVTTTSSSTKKYKQAVTNLPEYAEGAWTSIVYNVQGNSLGDREMGMELWLGEGLKDAETLVMGGAIFADVKVTSYASPVSGVTYSQLSSFTAGVNYDVYGLTAGALKDASGNLVGSYRQNTVTVGNDTYVIDGANAYKIGTESQGKYDATMKKLTIGDSVRYFRDDNGTVTVYSNKNLTDDAPHVAGETYSLTTNLYKDSSANVYYIKGDKVYLTTPSSVAVSGNTITVVGTDYTIASISGNYVDASELHFDFKAADGLFNTGDSKAYVVSSEITKDLWNNDATLKNNLYPYGDEGVKSADSADPNTKFATIVVEHSSPTASILTLGDVDGYQKGAIVYPNKYYRYSVLVKTGKNNVGAVTLQLIAWNTAADKTTATSLKSVSSIDTEGEWVEYVFYISGAYVEGRDSNALTAQLLFGSGDAYSPSTHAKGVVYLTAATFIEVTYSEYSSKNTGENVSSYSYSSSLYTSETVTNGRFTSVDYDKTLESNQDYDVNAYDENGKLIGVGTPSGGWTAVEADYDKLTTPSSKLDAFTASVAYDVLPVTTSVEAPSALSVGEANVTYSKEDKKDTLTLKTDGAQDAYVLYRKDRKTSNIGELSTSTNVVMDKITVKVEGSKITLVVPNTTSAAYSNYYLLKGTTVKNADAAVTHDKGQDTVTFTFTETGDDLVANFIGGGTVNVYYDTADWYYTDPKVGVETDGTNNLWTVDGGVSNLTGKEYVYGYVAVSEYYQEEITATAVASGTGEVDTTVTWTKTSKYTSYFIVYHIEIYNGDTQVAEYFEDNVSEQSYTFAGEAYNSDYDYKVTAIWAVSDAKKTEIDKFTISWSHTLTEDTADSDATYVNYYGYEVYFVRDGEGANDKYFVTLLDSTHADIDTIMTDAPSTSGTVTTHTYTYKYVLPTLAKGTYYIRAVVDSSLRDTAVKAGQTLTYGQKYCPSGYVTVYFNPDNYVGEGKYWINWSSATFAEFSKKEGETFGNAAVLPDGYLGYAGTLEDLVDETPALGDTTKEYKSMITYAGIISKSDFNATDVFSGSTNAADYVDAIKELYPTEGEVYNGSTYNRTEEEKSKGIWSFGYSATDFVTVNEKYDNLLMIASDVETVKGYTSSSATTLSASSYYVLSFWVKTVGDAKASIIVDNQSNIFNATADFDGFRSINTGDEWVQYRLLIKVGFNDAQVKLGLYLGEPSKNGETANRSSGIVFFDDINFTKLADLDAYNQFVTAAKGKTLKSYTVDPNVVNAYDTVEASTIYSNGFVYQELDYVTDSFDVHKDDAKEVLGNTPKDYTQAMDTGDDLISNDNETRAYGVYNADKMVSTTDYAAFLKAGTSYDDDDVRAQDWYTINNLTNLQTFVRGYGNNTMLLANFALNAQYMKSTSKTLETDGYYKITFYAKAMLKEGEYGEFRLYKDSTSGVYTSVRIYGRADTGTNEYGFHKYTVYVSNTSGSSLTAYYSFHLGTGRITEKDDNGETVTKVESHLVMGLLVVDNVTLEKIDADVYTAAVGETAEVEGSLKKAEADANAADSDDYLLSRLGYLEVTSTDSEEEEETDGEAEEEEETSWGANEWLILSSALISAIIVIAVAIYMIMQFKKKYVKTKVIGENKVDAEKKTDVVIKQQRQDSNTAYTKDRSSFDED